jgi:hypothetical protein
MFIVAPMIGAIIAAVVWKYVLDTSEAKPQELAEDEDEIAEIMADLDSV